MKQKVTFPLCAPFVLPQMCELQSFRVSKIVASYSVEVSIKFAEPTLTLRCEPLCPAESKKHRPGKSADDEKKIEAKTQSPPTNVNIEHVENRKQKTLIVRIVFPMQVQPAGVE